MKEMIERIKTLPYLQNMKVREVEKNAITFISENGREKIDNFKSRAIIKTNILENFHIYKCKLYKY